MEIVNKLLEKKEKQIKQLENEIECLRNKDHTHETFNRIRTSVYSALHDKIPSTMGYGNKRFRERRELILAESKRQLDDFDKYFNYTHDGVYCKF